MRQNLQHLADRLLSSDHFSDGEVGLDLIPVASALSFLQNISGVGQVCDDSIGGSFGDAKLRRDVSQSDSGVVRDADENASVVGEEAPLLHERSLIFPEINC